MERPDAADRRHDTLSEHQEVIRAIEPAVADHLRLLLPLDRAWQPTDYLPDLETANWRDEVGRFRTAAEAVSDDLLVVLVGDMITESRCASMAATSAIRSWWNRLGRFVEWVPVCPEVESGLDAPRESMRLVQVDGRIRVTGTPLLAELPLKLSLPALKIRRCDVRAKGVKVACT